MAINKKRVGEWLITQEEIITNGDNPYLDLTSPKQELSVNNWPDLVPFHRNQKYKFGDVTQADIIDVIYYPNEAHLLLCEDEFSTKLVRDIYEDQQYHYTYEGGTANTWHRTITLPNALKLNGTTMMPAGEYRVKRAEFTSTFLATNDINALHSGVVLQLEFKDDYETASSTYDVVNSAHNNNRIYKTTDATNWADVGTSTNPGYHAWTSNNNAYNHLVAINSNDYNFGTSDFTIDTITKQYNSIYLGSKWILEKCEPDERRWEYNTYTTAGMRNAPLLISGNVYHANDGNGYLVERDFETMVLLRSTNLGVGQGQAYDGSHIWLADSANSRLRKVELAGLTVVADVTVGANPYSLLYLSGFIYSCNYGAASVSKVDVSNNTVSGTASVGSNAINIAYDNNGFIWVSNNGTTTVSYINAATFTTGGTVTVGTNPEGIVYHSGYIYVANYTSNSISKIDISSKTVVDTISDSHTSINNPIGLAVTPENLLLITENTGNRMRVFDLEKQVLSKYWTAFGWSFNSPRIPLIHSGQAFLHNAGNSYVIKWPYATMWANFSWSKRDATRNAGFGTYLSGKLYIPNTNNNEIVVLNTSTCLFEPEIIVPTATAIYQTIVVSGNIFATGNDRVAKINPTTSGVVGTYVNSATNKTITYDNNGFVWVTNTNGSLHKINVDTMSGTAYTGFDWSFASHVQACILSGNLFVSEYGASAAYRVNLNDPTKFSKRTTNNTYGIACDDNYIYIAKGGGGSIMKFDPLVEDWKNASPVERYGVFQAAPHILTRDTVNGTGFWLGGLSTAYRDVLYMDGYAQWNIGVAVSASMNEGGYHYVIPGDSNASYTVNFAGTYTNIARMKSGPRTTYGMFQHHEADSSPARYLIGYYGGPGKVLINNNPDTTLNKYGDSTTYNFYTRISRKNGKTGMWLWGQYDDTNTYWGNFLKLQGYIDDTTNYNSNYNLYIGGNQRDGDLISGPQTIMRYLSIIKNKALSFAQSEYGLEPRLVVDYSNALKINGINTLITINGKGDRSLNPAGTVNISDTHSQNYINKTPGQTASAIAGSDTNYAKFRVNNSLNFGTSDFTIQMWFKIFDQQNGYLVVNGDDAGTNAWKLFYEYIAPAGINSKYTSKLKWSGQTYDVSSDDLYNTLKKGKWHHVAVSRSGTNLGVYLNGTRVISTTDTDNYNSGLPFLFVGSNDSSGGDGIYAYMDEVRVDSGVALYTGTTAQIQTRGQVEFYPKRVAGNSSQSLHYPLSDTYLAINGDNTAVGLRSRANVGRHREVYYTGTGDVTHPAQLGVQIGGSYVFAIQSPPLNQGKTNEFSNPAITINKPKTSGVKIYEWAGRYKP